MGFRILAGVVAVLLALTPGALPVSAAPNDPIVVGLSVPLSPPGDIAAGQLIRRGAELGIEYVNTKMKGVLGGRRLELAVEDDSGQNEAGIAAYRRLVSEKHAVAVTGYFHSSVNIAVNEVAKELGVATIGTQTSAADVTAKHYDVAFRTHTIDPFRVSAWLEWIKKNNYKKISMLAETSDYGLGLVKETEAQNADKKLGLTIQSLTFDKTTTDLTPQLLQIKAFGPDAVLNVGVGAPADLIIDQAATIGLFPKTPMLASYDFPIRPQFWKLHEKDGAQLAFIAYFSPKVPLSDIGNWFAKAYEAKYKEAPVYSSLNGFGDVLVIAEAIERGKSADPKNVVKALAGGSFHSWSTDDVTFPEGKGAYWHTWAPPVLILQYTAPNQSWRDATVVVSHKPKQT